MKALNERMKDRSMELSQQSYRLNSCFFPVFNPAEVYAVGNNVSLMIGTIPTDFLKTAGKFIAQNRGNLIAVHIENINLRIA